VNVGSFQVPRVVDNKEVFGAALVIL